MRERKKTYLVLVAFLPLVQSFCFRFLSQPVWCCCCADKVPAADMGLSCSELSGTNTGGQVQQASVSQQLFGNSALLLCCFKFATFVASRSVQLEIQLSCFAVLSLQPLWLQEVCSWKFGSSVLLF